MLECLTRQYMQNANSTTPTNIVRFEKKFVSLGSLYFLKIIPHIITMVDKISMKIRKFVNMPYLLASQNDILA